MNERLYKIYKIYLKLTSSKKPEELDLESIKKDIGKEILKTKIIEDDQEEFDLNMYFKNRKK